MVSLITPVLCLMAVFFAYGLIKFDARRNEAVLDGPPIRNDSRIQLLWLVITTTMVLFLAGFGTYGSSRTARAAGRAESDRSPGRTTTLPSRFRSSGSSGSSR